ncbi:ATP-binding cassette domain-containing protein [Ignatzschineria sp. LJL83]
MLKIEDLSLFLWRYQSFFKQEKAQQLHHLNFTIKAGEMTALIGSSGAGKSLLAHAILGLLPKNIVVTGDIFLNNQQLTPKNLPKLRKKEIAFLPQQISCLDPTATIQDQLLWSAKRAGVHINVSEKLESVELQSDIAKYYPHEISGGMARRILMLQTTLCQRDLIIADEPTAGLDPDNREIILQQLEAQASQGAAILLITHDLLSVLEYADQIAIMHEGRLISTEKPTAFEGSGKQLSSPFVQELWRAIPQNGLYNYV